MSLNLGQENTAWLEVRHATGRVTGLQGQLQPEDQPRPAILQPLGAGQT